MSGHLHVRFAIGAPGDSFTLVLHRTNPGDELWFVGAKKAIATESGRHPDSDDLLQIATGIVRLLNNVMKDHEESVTDEMRFRSYEELVRPLSPEFLGSEEASP
jgi:hypothetical protein